MSDEKPVLGNEESDRDADSKPVTEQTADRRRLIRKLVTLAGLGITGVLLSQDKAGLLPIAQAYSGGKDGTALIIGAQGANANTSAGITELDSSFSPGQAFWVEATGSNGIGIFGYGNSSSGIGVQGAGGSIGVLGNSTTYPGSIPIVATGAYGQTANLQEWQNYLGSALSVVDKNGNFGIGTSTPARAVHLVGHNANFRMDRDIDTAAFILVRTAAGNFNTIWKTFYVGVNASGVNNGYFFIGDNAANTAGTSTTRLIIDNTGRVGLGRTPSANNLEVEGTASKTTAGSWLANSDMRIKTEISDIDDALATIRKLHPVRFRYTDSYKAKHPSIKNHPYYNFIAQEYREVFPDSVQDDGEGLLQMDSYNTTPYLVRAVQELSKQNEALAERDSELAQQNSELAEQNEGLREEVRLLKTRLDAFEQTIKLAAS